MDNHRHYLPAAGHDWFLPLYDPLTRLLGARTALQALVDQAGIGPGQRVLDIGCGTGALALLIATQHPDVTVTGLDPDPRALARAEKKARRTGLTIRWVQGFGDATGEPDGSFDRVTSSLMLHHMAADEQRATLEEALRLVRPGGSIHIVDFRPKEQGVLEHMLTEVGFRDVAPMVSRPMLFAALGYFRGTR